MKNTLLILLALSPLSSFASNCSINLKAALNQSQAETAWQDLHAHGFTQNQFDGYGATLQLTASSGQASGGNILRAVRIQWTGEKGNVIVDETVESYKFLGLVGSSWNTLISKAIAVLPASCEAFEKQAK